MKKKYIYFIMTLSIIVIIFGFFLLSGENSNKKPTKKVDKEEEIKQIISNDFYSDDTTISELEKITNSTMLTSDIVFGKDSTLREKPKDAIYKKFKLNKYESTIDKYATIVEKRFISKLEYSSTKVSSGNVDYKIKPWYFYNYSSDLTAFTVKILDYINYDVSKLVSNYDEYSAYEYRARAIALDVMNNHLINYDNTEGEIVNYEVRFTGDKPDKDSLYSLYQNLIGTSSKHSIMNGGDETKNQDTRVSGYLNEAIQKGLINKDNFFN